MILVDERVGSRELLQRIRALGVPADLAHLDADFQFTGNGESGPVLIGIERKTITDLLQSMRDRRLAGQQIGRMIAAYDVCGVVVEGVWRRQRDTGLVELRNGEWRAARGKYHYAEVSGFLCSLREMGGVRVWRTGDEDETCAWLVTEFSWWQKQWLDHRSNKSVYAPEPVSRSTRKPSLFPHQSTLVERWLANTPGVDSRAIDLAKYFSSGRDLANADVDRWMTIKGERIGRKTAEKIVEAIAGNDSQTSE